MRMETLHALLLAREWAANAPAFDLASPPAAKQPICDVTAPGRSDEAALAQIRGGSEPGRDRVALQLLEHAFDPRKAIALCDL